MDDILFENTCHPKQKGSIANNNFPNHKFI
jgi:hypothetical protein